MTLDLELMLGADMSDEDLAEVRAFVGNMKGELELARELNVKLSTRIAELEAEVEWFKEELEART